MIGVLATAILTGAPLLLAIGVLRMLVSAAEVLLEMGYELALELRWLLGVL